MMQSISIANLIILIGAVQGLFLSIVLWNWKKGNRISHRLLSLFLLFSVCSMTSFVLWDSRYILQIPHLSLVVAPTEVALGPVFYLYVLSLTKQNFKLRLTDYLHFLPSFITIGYFLPFYLESASEKVQFNLQSYETFPALWLRFSIASSIYISVYMLVTMLVIARHRQTIKKYYSDVAHVNLGWIQGLFFLCLIAFICCGILSFIGYSWSNHFSNIIFSACIYAFGYYGLKQKEIFNDIREHVETEIPEPAVIKNDEVISKKYEKSGLTEERAKALLFQLEKLMASDKLYLNPELNLQQLADRLSVTIHHLSQVLNQQKKQNFFDYVNALRIEEFKIQLSNPAKQHLSLLGLAFECGFNSKASFNAAFKKYTGSTPSAYRKELNIETA